MTSLVAPDNNMGVTAEFAIAFTFVMSCTMVARWRPLVARWLPLVARWRPLVAL